MPDAELLRGVLHTDRCRGVWICTIGAGRQRPITHGADTPEILDVDSQKFREIDGRLPDAFRFAAAARLGEGDVFITGGYSLAHENHGRRVALQATSTLPF